MLRYAFKEWAVICDALSRGEQTVILRKGGIAEENGTFKPDHAQFWLFPTYLHQQEIGLKPTAASRLPQIIAEQPPSRTVTLTHFVAVATPYFSARLDLLLLLDPLHAWSEHTVRQRFVYRQPGLFVLPARVYRAKTPVTIENRPEYDGCKTWVDLESANNAPPEGEPVLSDRDFAHTLEQLETILHPRVQV